MYSGGLDPTVRNGVHVALDGFLELVEGGEPGLPGARRVRALRPGGAAQRPVARRPAGRLPRGARAAWRGLAAAGDEAGVDPRTMYTLAEAIFAFIDDISSASAEGHAFEDSLVARELAVAAAPPAGGAAGGLRPSLRRSLRGSLPTPNGPCRSARRCSPSTRRPRGCPRMRWWASWAAAAWAVVAGSSGRRSCGARSWRAGRAGPGGAAGRSVRLGAPGGARVGNCRGGVSWWSPTSDCSTCCCGRTWGCRRTWPRRPVSSRRLARAQRSRLLRRWRAWLDAHGEARPAAERLHVHVQTVRYRLEQLRELLGDALDDPERRLELALALRVRGVGAGAPRLRTPSCRPGLIGLRKADREVCGASRAGLTVPASRVSDRGHALAAPIGYLTVPISSLQS